MENRPQRLLLYRHSRMFLAGMARRAECFLPDRGHLGRISPLGNAAKMAAIRRTED
jgi:hypothetical protein